MPFYIHGIFVVLFVKGVVKNMPLALFHRIAQKTVDGGVGSELGEVIEVDEVLGQHLPRGGPRLGGAIANSVVHHRRENAGGGAKLAHADANETALAVAQQSVLLTTKKKHTQGVKGVLGLTGYFIEHPFLGREPFHHVR